MSVGGLCDKCTRGGLLNGEPEGAMQASGAYLARGPANTESSNDSKKCLVLFTDVFGLPVKNCKLIADQMAKRIGCDVYVPDMFNGTPPLKPNQLHSFMPKKPGDKVGIFGYLRLFVIFITRLPWILSNRAKALDARNHKFLTGLRENGYTKIGAFGYCMGGSAATRLAATKDIDSAVLIHPGRVTDEEITAIRIPVAFAVAEEDMSFPPKRAQECEAILAKKKAVQFEFQEYKGVAHGFAARPHLEIPEHKTAFEACFEQTAKWFEKTL